MTTLSIKDAIKEAGTWVGTPSRQGASWTVYGPYRDVPNLRGPSASVDAYNYFSARAIRTKWVARIALQLMGRWSEAARFAIEDEPGSVRDLVALGVAAFEEENTL
jgi:hypothetical protein